MPKSESRKAPGAGRRTATKRAKIKSTAARSAAVRDVKTVTAAVADREPSDEEIRVRAYFRYLERGGEAGDSLADWAEARKDLETLKK